MRVVLIHVLNLGIAAGLVANAVAESESYSGDPGPSLALAALIVVGLVIYDITLLVRRWWRWVNEPAPASPRNPDRRLFDYTTGNGLRLRSGGTVLLGGRRALVTDEVASTPGYGPVVVDENGHRLVLDGRHNGLVTEADGIRTGRLLLSTRLAVIGVICCFGPIGWVIAFFVWSHWSEGAASRRRHMLHESRRLWEQRRGSDADLDRAVLMVREIREKAMRERPADHAFHAALEVLGHDRNLYLTLLERARTAIELRQSVATPDEFAEEMVRQALAARRELMAAASRARVAA